MSLSIEELYSLVDKSLNLNNKVDFESLNKLLHGIIYRLAQEDSKSESSNSQLGGRDETEEISITESEKDLIESTETPDEKEISNGEADGVNDLIEEILDDVIYVSTSENAPNNDVIVALEKRIKFLEQEFQQLDKASGIIQISINGHNEHHSPEPNGESPESDFREENATGSSVDSYPGHGESNRDAKFLKLNERRNSEVYREESIANLKTLVKKVDQQIVRIDYIENELYNQRRSSDSNNTSNSQQIIQPNEILESHNMNALEETNAANSQHDTSIISVKLEQIPTEMSKINSSLCKRLDNLERKYKNLQCELRSIDILREEIGNKISMEILDTIIKEWQDAAQIFKNSCEKGTNDAQEKIDSLSADLISTEKRIMDNFQGLEILLADQVMQIEEKMEKIKTDVQNSEREEYHERREAAGGKYDKSDEMTCISCNQYVTMRVREPHCLSQVIAEPLTRISKPWKQNYPAEYVSQRFNSAIYSKDHSVKKSERRRLSGGRHTTISSQDRQSRLEMQSDGEFGRRLICVDTRNSSGNINGGSSKILGGIVSGVLASELYNSQNN